MSGVFITTLRRIWRLAEPPRWALPTIVVLGLLSAVLEGAGLYLFIPLVQEMGAGGGGGLLSGWIDRLVAPLPADYRIPLLVAGLCLSIAGKNAVSFVGGYAARHLDGIVAHRLRIRVFRQSLTAAVDSRADTRLTDVVNTLTSNTWKVSHGLSLIFRLLVCSSTIVILLAVMVMISAKLTLLALAMLAASAGLLGLLARRAQSLGKGINEENRRFGLRMWEGMGALALIRSFGREEHEIARLQAASDGIRRRMLSQEMTWAALGPFSEITGAVLIGLLILAGSATGAGLASMAAFLAVLYRLQGPTRELMHGKLAVDGLESAVQDVDDFLQRTRQPLIVSGAREVGQIAQGIEFRNVTFRYAADGPAALENVSFHLPAGRTTAIVGRSGAGKSTLAALLMRLRDPATGEVLVDGAPLRELELSQWRAALSLMPQEAQLFNDTIAANIAYGDLEASRSAIEQAAAVAGAAEFIRHLPQGYETEVGDRGARLSGGQRQRIALARTILREPQLLLLDEPTNALDVETEQAFQAALRTFSKSRTVVVIAHRLSTVRDADQVIVMDAGRVVEAGAPRELLARPSRFAELHGLYAKEVA